MGHANTFMLLKETEENLASVLPHIIYVFHLYECIWVLIYLNKMQNVLFKLLQNKN